MKKIIYFLLTIIAFSNCVNSRKVDSVETKNDSINKIIANLVGNWSLAEKNKTELNINKALFYQLRIDSLPKSFEVYPNSVDISAMFTGVSDSIKKQIFPFESMKPIKIIEMDKGFGFLLFQNPNKTIKIKAMTNNILVLESGQTYIRN